MNNYQTTISNRKSKKPFSYYKRLLLSLYALVHNGLSYQEIADTLNQVHIKTPSGKEWTALNVQVTVSRLNDSSYSGWIVDAKERLVEQGLLSDDALAAMAKRKRSST